MKDLEGPTREGEFRVEKGNRDRPVVVGLKTQTVREKRHQNGVSVYGVCSYTTNQTSLTTRR